MNNLAIGAILVKVSTLADHGLKLVFHTNEVSPEQGAFLMQMAQKFGWLAFAGEMNQVEIPDDPPKEFKSDKSLSQRLRDHIYVWWDKAGRPDTFDEFRQIKMEKIMEWIKGKIEELEQ